MNIEELKNKVKAFCPEGWVACEGFFISFDTMKTYPEHVSIAPRTGLFMEKLLKVAIPERKEWKRQWYEGNRTKAKEVASKLVKEGYTARADGGTVYVFNR